MNYIKIFVLLATMTIFTASCGKENNPSGDGGDDKPVNIVKSGKVLCDSKGVAGVVVTDGTNFTLTAADGAYELPYNPSATHVYISSPAGYTVPVERSVPKFWVALKNAPDKKNINFVLNKMGQSDNKHYFIAVGDPQVRNETELKKLEPILAFMRQEIASASLSPVHLMVAGDVVFNKPLMNDLSRSYFSAVNQPVYYSIGNHDHLFSTSQTPSYNYDKVADSAYIRHYGPTFYSFNRGMVHYISLDNIYYKGGPDGEYTVNFTEEQLSWVRNDLSYVTKDKALVLLFHAPSKSRYASSYGNSETLHALLQGYANVQIICGHTHYNSVMKDNTGITEHIVGAACGGFWEGPVCLDGAELGYKIFEVNGTDFKWIYRSYTNPDSQFSVYKPENRAPVLRPSDELLVNVWDWDPDWKVMWSDNHGATYQEMVRISEKTMDPTAYSWFGADGDNKISGRTWINAVTTDHIFKCIPGSGIKEVKIKVTNSFGVDFTRQVNW
ncbi:Metallophosphoesterase [Bacteroidales bacterium CF]|jgi:Calcineurin-like phosphoesterase.|nr:Metallophosphoesterase [Bacteroidales bacterium CF]